MKKILPSVLLLFISIISFGQCPTTPVVLNTQAEVDAFATNYAGCSTIDVRITISGSDIVDLSGLSQITVMTDILVINNCPNLTTFVGLSAIELSGSEAGLSIFNAEELSFITSFTQSPGQIFALGIINAPLITSLDAFTGITNIVDLAIQNCHGITNLDDLTNLETVEHINIVLNDGLLNLNGLSNVTGVLEELNVSGNPLLEDLTGLEGVTDIIGLGMSIVNNDALLSLSGLENVVDIEGFEIVNNDLLENLNPLSMLIDTDYIDINGNQLLSDISAIGNVGANIPSYISIQNNPTLSTCNIDLLCNYFFNGGDGDVSNNAQGCNSTNEILFTCGLNTNDNLLPELIIIYPNPTFDVINFITENTLVQKVSLFSVSGKILSQTTSNQIDLSSYSSGVYFITIETSQGTITKKIVKE